MKVKVKVKETKIKLRKMKLTVIPIVVGTFITVSMNIGKRHNECETK